MPQIRSQTAARHVAAALAALVALALVSGCGDKGRREPGNPFIGPSGADHSEPFGARPSAGQDGRLAVR